jgi:hypothetical protein
MSSSRNQSLTYAPDSIRPSSGRARSTASRQPAWILCRNLDAVLPMVAVLLARVLAATYIPALSLWLVNIAK